MITQTLKRTASLCLFGLLFLSVLEVCARVDDAVKWGAPLLGTYSRESLTMVDELGYRNRPNAQFEKWKINSFGFRGAEIQRQAPDGTIRIMILGASETFGLYEEPGKEFPAQLEVKLNQVRAGRFQVLNAAVPGISPPRLKHLYEHWLADFRPDWVIYYPSLSVYLLWHPPGPLVLDTIPQQQGKVFESRILAKVRVAVKRFLPERLQTAMRKILIRQAVADIPQDRIFHHPPPERLKLLEQQLAELVRTIQASGARTVLTTHAVAIEPPLSDHEQQLLTGWRKLYPHVAETAFLEMENLGNQTVKKVAAATGSDLIDIDAQLPKSQAYFTDHVHFTTEGAEQMAKILTKALLSLF